MLGIVPGKDGWHTYYLRRQAHGAPLPRLADAFAEAMLYALVRLGTLAGKPWRRVRAWIARTA